LPYISTWMTLLDAIHHVHTVERGSLDDACRSLFKALCDGGVKSRRVGDDRMVSPSFWYGATIFRDGSVTHGYNPQAHPAHLQPPSFHYEVRRRDLLKWWSLPVACRDIGSSQNRNCAAACRGMRIRVVSYRSAVQRPRRYIGRRRARSGAAGLYQLQPRHPVAL